MVLVGFWCRGLRFLVDVKVVWFGVLGVWIGVLGCEDVRFLV